MAKIIKDGVEYSFGSDIFYHIIGSGDSSDGSDSGNSGVKIVELGALGETFDLSVYNGYENFTLDNFYVQLDSVSTSAGTSTINYWTDAHGRTAYFKWAKITGGSANLSELMSYDATTGQLITTNTGKGNVTMQVENWHDSSDTKSTSPALTTTLTGTVYLIQESSGGGSTNNIIVEQKVVEIATLGAAQTIDLSSYPGYENFTVEKNIFLGDISAVTGYNAWSSALPNSLSVDMDLTYDASTGILSIPSYYGEYVSGTQNPASGDNLRLDGKVYLVYTELSNVNSSEIVSTLSGASFTELVREKFDGSDGVANELVTNLTKGKKYLVIVQGYTYNSSSGLLTSSITGSNCKIDYITNGTEDGNKGSSYGAFKTTTALITDVLDDATVITSTYWTGLHIIYEVDDMVNVGENNTTGTELIKLGSYDSKNEVTVDCSGIDGYESLTADDFYVVITGTSADWSGSMTTEPSYVELTKSYDSTSGTLTIPACINGLANGYLTWVNYDVYYGSKTSENSTNGGKAIYLGNITSYGTQTADLSEYNISDVSNMKLLATNVNATFQRDAGATYYYELDLSIVSYENNILTYNVEVSPLSSDQTFYVNSHSADIYLITNNDETLKNVTLKSATLYDQIENATSVTTYTFEEDGIYAIVSCQHSSYVPTYNVKKVLSFKETSPSSSVGTNGSLVTVLFAECQKGDTFTVTGISGQYHAGADIYKLNIAVESEESTNGIGGNTNTVLLWSQEALGDQVGYGSNTISLPELSKYDGVIIRCCLCNNSGNGYHEIFQGFQVEKGAAAIRCTMINSSNSYFYREFTVNDESVVCSKAYIVSSGSADNRYVYPVEIYGYTTNELTIIDNSAKFTKSVTIGATNVTSVSMDISKDYPDYRNITIDDMVINMSSNQLIADGEDLSASGVPKISYSYDNSTGIITASTSTNVVFTSVVFYNNWTYGFDIAIVKPATVSPSNS